MVKLTIEADTPGELAEAARKLTEPPAVKLDAKRFAKLARRTHPQTEATRDTCEEFS